MFRILLVLLWRHFVSRTRKLNILVTLLEFGGPVGILVLLFLLRNGLSMDRPMEESENTTMRVMDPVLIDGRWAPQRIIFGPDTASTRAIMGSVAQKLRLKIVDKPPAQRARGIYAYKDDQEVRVYSKNMTHNDAIVIFNNIPPEEMPTNLNYTIRIKENYKTHMSRAQDDADRAMAQAPHHYFGAIYEPFMHLQWAIDSSFLESLTGSPIEQTVRLQELPYSQSEPARDRTLPMIIVSLFVFLAMVFVFEKLVYRLIEERVVGMRVLQQNVGVSPLLQGVAHFLNVLPAGVIMAVAGPLVLACGAGPLLERADWALLVLTFLLYFSSFMAFAYFSSFILNGMRAAGYIGSVIGLMTFIVACLSQMLIKRRVFIILTGFLPHVPAFWMWKAFFESQNEDSLDIKKRYQRNSESALTAIIMMLMQIVLYSGLAAYLYRVRPGEFGIAEPWDFLCKPSFWFKKKVLPQEVSIMEDEDEDKPDPKYFEPASKRLQVGIKVVNVSKIFKGYKALNHVNLEVYKGEITVLLGHNGAGKTTLMNIITGMYSATEGDVYVNGKHTVHDAAATRKDIGLCPQHHIFFKNMSVLHHVMFFTLVKGVSWREARASSFRLLKSLNLLEKADASPSDLSGGMKRRLQLACALAGDCGVLALDEPTSGLDVETRRELWDLLLKLRGSRTVLLTTHFMEEADALGDRAAALMAGRLRCHATPMFLKRAIGSGYRLTLLTDGPPREQEITSLVTNHIAANLTEKSMNTLVYNIPSDDTKNLPAMFRELEENRAELNVENIGIGASTLEDVFLKLCSNVDTNVLQDEIDSAIGGVQVPLLTGRALTLSRVRALLVRQLKYTRANLLFTLIGNILIPFMIVGLVCYYGNNDDQPEEQANTARRMSIDGYSHSWQAPYNVENPVDALFRDNDERFWRSSDVLGDVINRTLEGKSKYDDYLFGIEINATDAKAYFTTGVPHAAPAALNYLSNVLAAQRRPTARPARPALTTYNHPLEGVYVPRTDQLQFVMPKTLLKLISVLPFSMILIQFSCLYATSLTSAEKESGARHVHYMTGVSRPLYWNTTLLYHMIMYCVTVVPLTMGLVIGLDRDSTFTGMFIVALLLVLLLNALATFSLAYLLVLLLSHRLAITVYVLCIIMFGLLCTPNVLLERAMGLPRSDDVNSIIVLYYAGQINPHMHAVIGVTLAGVTARLNALCALNRDKCDALVVLNSVPGFDQQACCGSDSAMRSYASFDNLSPCPNMLILLALFVVHMALIYLLESALFSRLWEKMVNRKFKPRPPKYNDANAKAEKAYVDRMMPLVRKHSVVDDEMLLSDLHKCHVPMFGKNIHAVNGVNFSVKKGECFGLLGVNGAGKSTTFKMITAENSPTQGDIYCGGNFVSTERNKYVSRLGYCPQFGGLDGFLCGRDNVELVLALRGMPAPARRHAAAVWLQAIGLERYALRAAKSYSGGCERRLACVMALCGGARVTLLDEPSAGVDPAARRRLWAALPRDRALVVTSHSMDEMEALSDRLAILDRGEVVAFGPPSAIRAAYARGHALVVKLTAEAHDHPEEVSRLKAAVLERYNAELKDEHATMLHFHINETMRYSELFEQMEELKGEFSVIEDYGVSETTLEEVFIAFARAGKEMAEAEAKRK